MKQQACDQHRDFIVVHHDFSCPLCKHEKVIADLEKTIHELEASVEKLKDQQGDQSELRDKLQGCHEWLGECLRLVQEKGE